MIRDTIIYIFDRGISSYANLFLFQYFAPLFGMIKLMFLCDHQQVCVNGAVKISVTNVQTFPGEMNFISNNTAK